MARNYVDTFDKQYWNLMQVLMWMIFRTREMVNEAAEENETQRTYIVELILPDGERRLVEQQADPCNALHIALHMGAEVSKGGSLRYKNFNEAWSDLSQRCQREEIGVMALMDNQGEYIKIPRTEFVRLKNFTDRGGRTYLEADNGLHSNTRWYAPIIERNVVLGFWPEIITRNFSGSATLETHLEEYRKYHDSRIHLYLNGEIPKLWENQINEESMIRDILKEGFDRKKFRTARGSILASYPSPKKSRLSKSDHEALKSFLNQKKS